MEPGDRETPGNHFPFLIRLEITPAWDAAAARFLKTGGTVMVLGEPDTGKSTLCRYLVYRAYLAGERVALVDLDLGQSHLGPPATLGLGLFPPRRPGDDSLFPEGLYFIGQTSPVSAVLEVVVGCRVLADLARDRGFSRLVVNTSGLVHGAVALRLKRSQAELLRPALILGLQRRGELEPLLRGLGAGNAALPEDAPQISPPPLAEGGKGEGGEILTPAPDLPHQRGGSEKWGPGREDSLWSFIRLPVSSRARRRSLEERRGFREDGFRRYFHGGRPLKLPWRALGWEGLPWGQGDPLGPGKLQELSRALQTPVLHGDALGRRVGLLLAVSPPEPSPEELQPEEEAVRWVSWPDLHWRLTGLLDGARRTLALGLILPDPWDPEAVGLWTPLDPGAASRVRCLKVGKMKVSLEGQELGHG